MSLIKPMADIDRPHSEIEKFLNGMILKITSLNVLECCFKSIVIKSLFQSMLHYAMKKAC